MLSLSGLNSSQRDAVSTLSGPLLVLAGAGTGKTRVITYRMANLIRHGVAPNRILSVTFTNKAAREMKERTAQLLGKRQKIRPLVSTFHSYCVRVLRQDIGVLGYPEKFTIYDRGDQESAARAALREIRISDSSLKPSDLLNRISQWKMAGVDETEAGDHIEADFDFLAAMAYRKYQKQLRACGAVDFDDLLLLTTRLFEDHPEIRERHQKCFDHVQIDEYQDTNGVQFRLVRTLVDGHRNLCVVGDDDQSIYGWRGAEVEHILNFDRHFPGTRIIRLQDNYRCTPRILEMANRLVRHNRNRHDKKLVPNKPMGSPVRILSFEDETAEAENVISEIRYVIDQLGAQPRDIAILFRTNEQPRIFEQELRRTNVPYQLVGGQSFFDRKEIRDILAYLKVIAFPRDEMSLLRILNVPARGIGTGSREKMLARAVESGRPLWEIIPQILSEGRLPTRVRAGLNELRGLIAKYGRLFEEQPNSAASLTRRLISDIRYEAELQKLYPEPEKAEARKAVLEEFVNSIGQFCEKSDSPTLADFIESTALMDRDEQAGEKQEQQNAVKLMTLHSAKGLEFPRVYLVGLEENLLPHRRSVESGLEKDIAEERRLAYVGITRAMDHLTVSRAKSRMKWGKRRPTSTSRFLFEMQKEPGDTLNEIVVDEENRLPPVQPLNERSADVGFMGDEDEPEPF